VHRVHRPKITAATRTLPFIESTYMYANSGQDRDKNLLSQLQKLKSEKKDIEEDVRQMVLMMEDRRAELTKQREGYEQVSLFSSHSRPQSSRQCWMGFSIAGCGVLHTAL
jgi:hypothetical protein